MLMEPKKDDLQASTVVEPAWYKVVIEDVIDKPTNSGTGTNSWFKGKVICNADNGDKKFEGVPTPFLWMISSNAPMVFSIPLWRSIGVEMEAGKRYDTQAFKGRTLEAFIGNELYQGVMQNKMEGKYRPAK